MDLNALAKYLAGRDSQPSLILDGKGRVVLINGAFERMAKASPAQILDRTWEDLGRSARAGQHPTFELLQAAAVPRFTSSLHLASGRALDIDWTSVPFGEGPDRGVVIHVLRVQNRKQRFQSADLTYQLRPGNGMVLDEDWAGEEETGTSRVCHLVLAGLESPCPGCPVPGMSREPGTSVAAVVSPAGRLPMRIMRATALDEGGVSVAATFVDDARFSAIMLCRANELGDRVGLSPRERAVFVGLVSGESLIDIANRLGITHRTSKYHQAKLLEKFGVDSRMELFRVLSENAGGTSHAAASTHQSALS